MTAYQMIELWIDDRIQVAVRNRDRSFHAWKLSPSDYTRGQYLYHKHQLATIRWIRSTIPKKFRDVITTIDLETLGTIIQLPHKMEMEMSNGDN